MRSVSAVISSWRSTVCAVVPASRRCPRRSPPSSCRSPRPARDGRRATPVGDGAASRRPSAVRRPLPSSGISIRVPKLLRKSAARSTRSSSISAGPKAICARNGPNRIGTRSPWSSRQRRIEAIGSAPYSRMVPDRSSPFGPVARVAALVGDRGLVAGGRAVMPLLRRRLPGRCRRGHAGHSSPRGHEAMSATRHHPRDGGRHR